MVHVEASGPKETTVARRGKCESEQDSVPHLSAQQVWTWRVKRALKKGFVFVRCFVGFVDDHHFGSTLQCAVESLSLHNKPGEEEVNVRNVWRLEKEDEGERKERSSIS